MAERPVVVCGAAHVGLAVSLAQAGRAVVMVETDRHDRARLTDMLARAGQHKVRIASDLDRAGPADLILSDDGAGCSGAVSLDWTKGSGTVLHLTSLPGLTGLVEIIGPDPEGRIAELAQALGARIVQLPEGATPLSLRCLAALSTELEEMLLTGTTPVEVDEALEDAGIAVGPFEAQDAIGVDTLLAERRAVFARHGGPAELPLFARAVGEGRMGRKVGVGWYRYPGGGGKVEDPLVEDMAVEEAHFARHSRHEIDAAEIVRRVRALVSRLPDELEKGAAASADDVSAVLRLVLAVPQDWL